MSKQQIQVPDAALPGVIAALVHGERLLKADGLPPEPIEPTTRKVRLPGKLKFSKAVRDGFRHLRGHSLEIIRTDPDPTEEETSP